MAAHCKRIMQLQYTDMRATVTQDNTTVLFVGYIMHWLRPPPYLEFLQCSQHIILTDRVC